MKSKNKLYTQSYFIKRLKDSNIFVKPLIKYSENDIRKWTIIIEPEKYNILCTCYKENSKNYCFKFDCQQKSNINVTTLSMKTIIENIKNLIDGTDKFNQLKEIESGI